MFSKLRFDDYQSDTDALVNCRKSIAHGKIRSGVTAEEFSNWKTRVCEILSAVKNCFITMSIISGKVIRQSDKAELNSDGSSFMAAFKENIANSPESVFCIAIYCHFTPSCMIIKNFSAGLEKT